MKIWIEENLFLAILGALALLAGAVLLLKAIFKTASTNITIENPEIVPTRTFMSMRSSIVPANNISVPSGNGMAGARVSMSGNNR